METEEVTRHVPSKETPRACLQCRRVKMKCHKVAQDTKCARCLRKSLQCDFIGHRRGRKQGFKLRRSSPRAENITSIRPENVDNMFSNTDPPRVAGQHPTTAINALDDENIPVQPHDLRQMIPRQLPTPDRLEGSNILREEFWTQSSGFRPADILNRQATRGMFSLQNVLSTRHGGTPRRFSQNTSKDDPIVKGLVNLHVSTSLFEAFMKHMNPFISQLDPKLHTFIHVRASSSFLFTAILAAAAKLLHTSLYHTLSSYAEELLMASFVRGSKSVEVIQAILISTYWKKPDDSRAWLSVGYAIRMAIELGWHQLGSEEMRPPTHTSEPATRQFRDIERTWLVLFVYDRSISFQTGKPWMIERSAYIEAASDWFRHPFAIANDRLLCAFVSLRLITSMHSDTMACRSVQEQRQQALQFRSLLRLLDRQIEDWQKEWQKVATDDGEDCHTFLIPFYGSYARLLLFTSPLRTSLRLKDITASVDTEAIWNSCSSALDMLKLVSGASTSQLLYFAQDSVHVMIAYATVFLIKLLVSAPAYIRSELERPAVEAIRDAAKTMAEQAAPETTSCALQAKFLHNVVLEYEASSERPQRARGERRGRGPLNPDDISVNTNITVLPRDADRQLDFPESSTAPTRTSQGFAALPAQDNRVVENAHSADTSDSLDFTSDEVWALLFANAGFNIDEGTFTIPS